MNEAKRGLPWRAATVQAIRPEVPGVATLVLRVAGWPSHRAGQHVDLRLTAEDGYQAQRSYSIASAPDGETVELTVEQVRDGEVSTFLLGDARIGDQLELRGPIGGYFAWEPGDPSPTLLVAGGSGVVPLMAMLRARERTGDGAPARLLYSARSADALIYREELDRLAASDNGPTVTYALTRKQPKGWTGEARRVDRAMLAARGFAADVAPRAYVCGPTPLVEQVATNLVALGYEPARVRTERFGPSEGEP